MAASTSVVSEVGLGPEPAFKILEATSPHTDQQATGSLKSMKKKPGQTERSSGWFGFEDCVPLRRNNSSSPVAFYSNQQPTSSSSSPVYLLKLICLDRKGLLHDVTQILCELDRNNHPDGSPRSLLYRR